MSAHHRFRHHFLILSLAFLAPPLVDCSNDSSAREPDVPTYAYRVLLPVVVVGLVLVANLLIRIGTSERPSPKKESPNPLPLLT